MNKTLTEKRLFFKCNCSCHLVQSYAIDEADIAIQEQKSIEVSDLNRLIDSRGNLLLLFWLKGLLWLPHRLKKGFVCPDTKCKSPIEVKAFQTPPPQEQEE
jgi:hypothetical protein